MGKVTGFMEYERLEEGYAPVAERLKNYTEFVIGLKPDEAKLQSARQVKRDAIELKKRQNRKRPRGLKERIHRIKARTVLVWGDSDRLFPAPYAHAFKDSIGSSELVIVPEAGHMVPVEQTGSVMAAIARLG